MKDELLRLAALCEQATGPSRMLGAQIAIAVGGSPERTYQQKCSLQPKSSPRPDRLDWAADWFGAGPTASIDAALMLANDIFVLITLSEIKGDGMPMCVIGNPGTSELFEAVADTMPLALCASALKARASMENK